MRKTDQRRLHTRNKKKLSRNQRGIATMEIIPLLMVFVVFVGFAIGLFTVIHTAILNSIAARTYTFETFRHRTNLTYFRNNRPVKVTYNNRGLRYHGIVGERLPSGNREFVSTGRKVSYGFGVDNIQGNETSTHTGEVMSISRARFTGTGVNPVWIRVIYGMCLDSTCGRSPDQ